MISVPVCEKDFSEFAWRFFGYFELPLGSFSAVYEDVFVFIGQKDCCMVSFFGGYGVACSEEEEFYFFHTGGERGCLYSFGARL